MKKKQPWFELYPDSDAASRLSIAGGAVKLLSILVLVAAVLYSLTVLWMLFRVGPGGVLHHMMDDWDEGFLPLDCLPPAATPLAFFRLRPAYWPGPTGRRQRGGPRLCGTA